MEGKLYLGGNNQKDSKQNLGGNNQKHLKQNFEGNNQKYSKQNLGGNNQNIQTQNIMSSIYTPLIAHIIAHLTNTMGKTKDVTPHKKKTKLCKNCYHS